MAMIDDAALIGVDWGTSSFRAYLLGSDGAIILRKSSHDGILTAVERGFARVLVEAIDDWLDPGRNLPVLMSGMIGSRQGWAEATYLACPANPGALAGQLLAIDVCQVERGGIGSLRIVPGLSCTDANGVPDVLRGEETQIMGVLAVMGLSSAWMVLPGTHSKWVRVEAGQVRSFQTYMTGEVYAALKAHTILGRLMQGNRWSDDAFVRGVEAGSRPGEGAGVLLHRIFSARTLGLFSQLAADEIAAYLSGLLIGAELSAAAPAGDRIVISGGAELAAHYEKAAIQLGLSIVVAPPDCVAAGHIAIARAAQLI